MSLPVRGRPPGPDAVLLPPPRHLPPHRSTRSNACWSTACTAARRPSRRWRYPRRRAATAGARGKGGRQRRVEGSQTGGPLGWWPLNGRRWRLGSGGGKKGGAGEDRVGQPAPPAPLCGEAPRAVVAVWGVDRASASALGMSFGDACRPPSGPLLSHPRRAAAPAPGVRRGSGSGRESFDPFRLCPSRAALPTPRPAGTTYAPAGSSTRRLKMR
jgi:hypothetical protein